MHSCSLCLINAAYRVTELFNFGTTAGKDFYYGDVFMKD